MKTALLFIVAATAIACSDPGGVRSSSCLAGAVTCDGSDVLVCNAQTGLFEVQQTCAFGSVCLNGQCVTQGLGDGFSDTFTADTFTPVDTFVAQDTFTAPDTYVPDSASPDTTLPTDTTPPTDTAIGKDTVVADTLMADTVEPVDTVMADTVEPVDTLMVDTVEPVDTVMADTFMPPDTTVADPFNPGSLVYESIGNIWVTGDLRLVEWHPSGDYALIVGSNEFLRYDATTKSVAVAGSLGESIYDLEVEPNGDFFLVAGRTNSGEHLWQVNLDANNTLVVDATTDIPLGRPFGIAYEPGTDRVAVGAASDNDNINYFYTWSPAAGLSNPKGFNAGAGLIDVMWGDPVHYAGSANIISSHGVNGGDSRTWVLASDTVVANGWSVGFGNGGRAAWRPGPGGFGTISGWTSNKLYVFDGTWTKAELPVPTGASPQGIDWRANGTRGLVVGRVIATPPYAVVVELRNGTVGGWTQVFTDQSIPNFDDPPWNKGTHSMTLIDVDWRPHACDEGLIVGSDNGSTWSPTFGTIIRYYDITDPACSP